MSRAQVAAEFGFSQSYLAHIPVATLPYYKIGTKVLYERAAVIDFIKGQVPGASPRMVPTTPKKGRPRKPVVGDRRPSASPHVATNAKV